MRKKVGLLAAAALLLAACGSGEVLSPPGDINEPLIQVSSTGGFVPVDYNIARGPTFTVTRDGKLLFPGAITLEYPGPLVLPVFESQLTSQQYQRILDLVDEMGIADMDDERDDTVTNVADASTEVIEYWDEDGKHRYSVYALGITDQPQLAATAAFNELFDYLHELSASTSGEPYEPELIRVVATASIDTQDPDLADIRPWPLAGENPHDWSTLTTVGDLNWTCKTFDSSVLNQLGDATQATLWTDPTGSDDVQSIQLLVRSLHPGEEACSLD